MYSFSSLLKEIVWWLYELLIWVHQERHSVTYLRVNCTKVVTLRCSHSPFLHACDSVIGIMADFFTNFILQLFRYLYSNSRMPMEFQHFTHNPSDILEAVRCHVLLMSGNLMLKIEGSSERKCEESVWKHWRWCNRESWKLCLRRV